MTDVFAIRDDGYEFQSLDLTILDIARYAPEDSEPDDILKFSLRNTAMSHWWPRIDAAFVCNDDYEDAPVPDISTGIGATLVLSPKAERYLGDLLKGCGELLPVHIENETYYLFNCLTLAQEDVDNSHYKTLDDGTPIELSALSFKDSTDKLVAFKSQYENCLTVFCNQLLKSAIEQFELTGVTFDENLVEVF